MTCLVGDPIDTGNVGKTWGFGEHWRVSASEGAMTCGTGGATGGADSGQRAQFRARARGVHQSALLISRSDRILATNASEPSST
jgi:hypothetical protein